MGTVSIWSHVGMFFVIALLFLLGFKFYEFVCWFYKTYGEEQRLDNGWIGFCEIVSAAFLAFLFATPYAVFNYYGFIEGMVFLLSVANPPQR